MPKDCQASELFVLAYLSTCFFRIATYYAFYVDGDISNYYLDKFKIYK